MRGDAGGVTSQLKFICFTSTLASEEAHGRVVLTVPGVCPPRTAALSHGQGTQGNCVCPGTGRPCPPCSALAQWLRASHPISQLRKKEQECPRACVKILKCFLFLNEGPAALNASTLTAVGCKCASESCSCGSGFRGGHGGHRCCDLLQTQWGQNVPPSPLGDTVLLVRSTLP